MPVASKTDLKLVCEQKSAASVHVAMPEGSTNNKQQRTPAHWSVNEGQ